MWDIGLLGRIASSRRCMCGGLGVCGFSMLKCSRLLCSMLTWLSCCSWWRATCCQGCGRLSIVSVDGRRVCSFRAIVCVWSGSRHVVVWWNRSFLSLLSRPFLIVPQLLITLLRWNNRQPFLSRLDLLLSLDRVLVRRLQCMFRRVMDLVGNFLAEDTFVLIPQS